MIRVSSWEDSMGYLNRKMIIDQAKRRIDRLILIGGFEGAGKSNLALVEIDELDKLRGSTTPINNVALTLGKWFDNLAVSQDGSILHLDEGKELAAQNWQKEEVKEFKRTITDLRYAGNIYTICFTNPADMIGYVRDDKVFIILMVRRVGKQYFVYGYSRQVFARILDDMEKKRIDTILAAKPNFICKIPLYKGHLLEPYMELKKAHVESAKKRGADKFGIKDKAADDVELMNQKECLDLLKMPRHTFVAFVKRKGLKTWKVPGSGVSRYDANEIRVIHAETVNKFLESHQSPQEVRGSGKSIPKMESSGLSINDSSIVFSDTNKQIVPKMERFKEKIPKMERLKAINKNLEGDV